MPNILRRPMFRKGGSVAYGTGITSGLEERKQYANGPDIRDIFAEETVSGFEPMPTPKSEAEMLTDIRPGEVYDPELYKKSRQSAETFDPRQDEVLQQMGIMSAIEGSMEPTGEEVVSDTMAALASTAPDDPRKLQSLGQVLGKAGAAARGLEKERESKRQEFRKEAGLQILKNMTSEEKDQLFRYAKKYSEETGMPLNEAYKLFLDRYLQGTPPKGLTEEQLYQTNIDRYMDSVRRANIDDAQVVARTMTKIQKGQTGGISGGPIEASAFKSKKGAEDAGAEVNRNYINPRDGKIYRYDGEGTFTQVWPSK